MLQFPRWKALLVLLLCVYAAIVAFPNLLDESKRNTLPDFLPHQAAPLGLDLRGGSHLLLQLDFNRYLREHMMNLRDQLRNTLRKERVGYLNLKATKDSVSLSIREETLGEDVVLKDLYRRVDPDFTITEKDGVTTLTYDEVALRAMRAHLLAQSIEIVNRRVNETGTKEPIIQRQGADRIIVQVPGLQDPSQLKALLGKTAKMNFHLVNEEVSEQQILSGAMPSGTKLLGSDRAGEQARVPVLSEVALSGELLINANATFQDGMPVVDFTFNSQGARIFGEITQANVGRRFAVVLDNKVITAPVIRSSILGGRGIIEGNFTVESANELAMLLRAGALPAPLNIIEERTVGPSLGQDSIDAGTLAATVGTVLVIVFMLLSYGLFGVFANVALMMNLVLIMAAMSLLQATLTLPGIAGIVLTMGMAVDANVLIYERIRDEIRIGRTPAASIEYGFKAAFVTIFDSNLTTLIAAALLYYFGSGSVKGFAVTLTIGILCSMFTSIMLTRLIIYNWARWARPKKLPI
ncbi:MAG: protein translocase subunit SecD [Alphaproteobacteria bacterium]|nr:protein translocase subunit SecD [Alphaproteobacteria bacterium]